VQDLSAVKESWPPVPEDQATREVRRLSAAQKKEEKDAMKKHQVKKALEREALNKRQLRRSVMSKSQERWWRPHQMREKKRCSQSRNQRGRSRSRSRTSQRSRRSRRWRQ
jgi:hypothetical protein